MCIEVISSQYHTGKLFFGINYTRSSVANFSASGVDPTTFYGKVIEVNSKENCFQITIPYQHWASWLDSAPNAGFFTGSTTFANTNIMSTYTQNTLNNGNYFTLGEWFVAVLNPLVVPAGVSTSVDLNIYMRGGENFEVHRPGYNGLTGGGLAQIETLGNQKSKVGTNTVTQFIERPRSIRELLKRAIMADRCRLKSIKGNGTRANRGCFYRQIDIDAVLRGQAPWGGIINSYASYIGDWRVKIVVDFSGMDEKAGEVVYVGFANRPVMGNTNDGTTSIIGEQLLPLRSAESYDIVEDTVNIDNFNAALGTAYQYSDVAATNGWETSHVITKNCNVLELEIPYYSMLKYTSGQNIVNNTTRGFGYLYYMQAAHPEAAGDTYGATITTYFYAGDSFRCGQWLGPAVLKQTRSLVNTSRYAYLGIPGITTVAARGKDENVGNDWDMSN